MRNHDAPTHRRAEVAAAVLVNVAFGDLAAVFDYPDVLKQPVDVVLASFRASQFAVTAWFLALAIGAAMLAPVAVGVGRLSGSRAMRWAVPVGVARGCRRRRAARDRPPSTARGRRPGGDDQSGRDQPGTRELIGTTDCRRASRAARDPWSTQRRRATRSATGPR